MFLLFVYICIIVRYPIISGVPLSGLISPRVLCLSQVRTWIHNAMCGCLFVLSYSRWEVIVHFCWYWWNCWPSLLKFSFHNVGIITNGVIYRDVTLQMEW